VEAELDGELELAADAVGGGDKDGVGEALGVQSEEAGEATDFAEDVFVEGAASEALDAFVGKHVAIGGDDGVVVTASGADFLVGGGGPGRWRRGGWEFAWQMLLFVARDGFCQRKPPSLAG
jgi:hypothetical protein